MIEPGRPPTTDPLADQRPPFAWTPDRPARVAALISGRGSNMRALVDANAGAPAHVVQVLSDKADAPGLATADALGLATGVATAKERAQREASLDAALRAQNIDLICLAGFMRVLSPDFVAVWAGRILNIHPSLLPNFPGLDTHQRALDAGVRLHGATVHLVTAALDDGPILAQGAVVVADGDTPETLAARILTVEHALYPATLHAYASGALHLTAEGVRGFAPVAERLLSRAQSSTRAKR